MKPEFSSNIKATTRETTMKPSLIDRSSTAAIGRQQPFRCHYTVADTSVDVSAAV